MYQHQAQLNKKFTTGMTLVEVLIAGMLLALGLVPVFYFSSHSLVLAQSARTTFTAGLLAQEGLEVIRTIRDDNWIAGRDFDVGLTDCDSGCRVQWDSTSVLSLGTDIALLVDSTNQIYQYNSGSTTSYMRTITIDNSISNAMRVQSKVDWRDQGGAHTFTAEAFLYDWLQ